MKHFHLQIEIPLFITHRELGRGGDGVVTDIGIDFY